METKPYNLQSPEQIAKDYGGNKQKIAEAMQMGLLDPTAGTMAGMFIDRMRSAAQMEAAPQQTVAQQVMAPQPQMPMGAPPAPPAPAGLGATPQAAAMPPMGAAPPMGMPAPQGEMPMMAMGGMVPPYASGGGLSDMPLPDGMFDEPSNGGFGDGYAGGGMVAFNPGGPVKAKGIASLLAGATEDELAAEEAASQGTADDIAAEAAIEAAGDIGVSGGKPQNLGAKLMRGTAFKAPSVLGGFASSIGENIGKLDTEVPREVKRAQQYQAYLDKMLDPEERKKSKKEDMWMALGQIGAKMATTPGSLLQAASAGIGEALPGIAASAKERRAEERAVVKELVGEERTGNKEIMERANIAMDMLKGYNVNEQAFQNQNFNNMLTRLGIDADIMKAKIMAGAGIREAVIAGSASRYGSDRQVESERYRQQAGVTEAVREAISKGGTNYGDYMKALTAGTGNQYIAKLRAAYSGGTVDLGSY
jgi:hypothetical protein